MNTKTYYVRLLRGFKEYLDPYNLINTQRNLTVVTNNWFNDLPQPNHFLPYKTFVFSSIPSLHPNVPYIACKN